MPEIANFIANRFVAPDRAEIDRDRYSNALYRNQVARLPQTNRAQDLGIQAAEQAIAQRGQEATDQQKANARGMLARGFSAVGQSPQPKQAALQFFSSPDFQAAGKLVGLPVEHYLKAAERSPDDVIRSGAIDYARMLGENVDQPFTYEQIPGPDGALLQRGPNNQVTTLLGREPQSPSPASGPKPPSAHEWYVKPDGTVALRPIEGGPADPNRQLPPKPPTEGQAKASQLSQRMRELAPDIVDTAPGISTQIMARIAQGGGITGALANKGLSAAEQKHFNAARGWLAGVLRQDTGATIQPFEIQEYYPTFFPVPGDTPQVIEQKRKLREVTVNAIAANAGSAGQSGPINNSGPPAGIDHELWELMSPEDRALWQ